MKFTVTLPDGETCDISLKSAVSGACLLDQVYQHLSIPYDVRKYFGLSYVDTADGGREWITPNSQLKRLNFVKCNESKQVIKKLIFTV